MEELANAQLARYTTLKVGGTCDHLYHPVNSDELLSLLDRLKQSGELWHVIGGGSNLLISSRGVRGSVIRVAQMTNIINKEKDLIEADAGARLPHLARQAASNGLSGLEFAVGIPGTVGGALVMNAGAHGSCIANVLESATIFDTITWKLITLSKEELAFEYRHSKINPDIHIVVSAQFRLKPGDTQAIEKQTLANEEYRLKTQPINWPNGGSTFKNPLPDKTAGFLLEQAGAKELAVGGACVSSLHANFIINKGGATSEEITSLLKLMQEAVYKKFGIRLIPEWKKIGHFTDEELAIWQ